jgi:hypothetical protein
VNTPQQLSQEAIEEFKAIYEEEFGQRLSDNEVQEIAVPLLRLFGLLASRSETDDQNAIPQEAR